MARTLAEIQADISATNATLASLSQEYQVESQKVRTTLRAAFARVADLAHEVFCPYTHDGSPGAPCVYDGARREHWIDMVEDLYYQTQTPGSVYYGVSPALVETVLNKLKQVKQDSLPQLPALISLFANHE